MNDSRADLHADLLHALTDTDTEEVNVESWINKIKKGEEKVRAWRDKSKKIYGIYSSKLTDGSGNPIQDYTYTYNNFPSSFNILFSNTETLKGALFSAMPKADVRSRHLSNDPVVESCCDVLEKVINYCLDDMSFDKEMERGLLDYLITGTTNLRFYMEDMEEDLNLSPSYVEQSQDIEQEFPSMEGDIGLLEQPIDPIAPNMMNTDMNVSPSVSKKILCEYIPYRKIVFDPQPLYKDVDWIAYPHDLKKWEIKKSFGDVDLSSIQTVQNRYTADPTYRIYEVWDRVRKRVFFITPGIKPLKVMGDPYNFPDFFSNPDPLYSIPLNDTLVPIPEYDIYESQANDLNRIAFRLQDITTATKVIGVYDAQENMSSTLFTSKDSQFVPVSSAIIQKGGVKGFVDMMDMSSNVQILDVLQRRLLACIQNIQEITGISDIVRGETKASETATAQQLKSNFASLRLVNRRKAINAFVADCVRKIAHLATTFFSFSEMELISGMSITPEMEILLHSSKLRNYKINIQTNSTIAAEMGEEARKRSEALTGLIEGTMALNNLVMQGVVPPDAARSLIKYGMAPTHVDKSVEDAIDQFWIQPPMESMGQPPVKVEENVFNEGPQSYGDPIEQSALQQLEMM